MADLASPLSPRGRGDLEAQLDYERRTKEAALERLQALLAVAKSLKDRTDETPTKPRGLSQSGANIDPSLRPPGTSTDGSGDGSTPRSARGTQSGGTSSFPLASLALEDSRYVSFAFLDLHAPPLPPSNKESLIEFGRRLDASGASTGRGAGGHRAAHEGEQRPARAQPEAAVGLGEGAQVAEGVQGEEDLTTRLPPHCAEPLRSPVTRHKVGVLVGAPRAGGELCRYDDSIDTALVCASLGATWSALSVHIKASRSSSTKSSSAKSSAFLATAVAYERWKTVSRKKTHPSPSSCP